ncbi:hypothetical protein F4809DRAFT_638962 [Biscogniauxia mediterranea]|nr:hypothetical protein F4809DRAFT_638962 [Biscogniauxia mediterranea]
MLYIVRQVVALAAVASLFLMANALPGAINNLARGSDSPLYIHPSFVPTPANETTDSLEARWKTTFKGADQQMFICEAQLPYRDPNPGALVDDCKAAMNDLLGMRGYWECSGWVNGNSFKYLELFSRGTCHVSVMSYKDAPTRIGNGDVYAFLTNTVKEHSQGNVAAAQGDAQCDDVKLVWSISSKAGAKG